MSTDTPRQHGRKRRQAPTHITLPAAVFSLPTPQGSAGSEGFKHTFPSTPATRSLTPASEIRNPFFILNEESPPAPVHPVGQRFRSGPITPPIRRPALNAQISREHAFGDTRGIAQHQDGQVSSAQDSPTSCPVRTPAKSKGRKELAIPSPISSRSPSRCSLVSEARSQPEVLSTKKKSTRPRARTVASEQNTPGIRWSLETPSFRSSPCMTPDVPGTPRQMSISEIPAFGCHNIGRPVDIFGLAALQPPREAPPRPKLIKRRTVAVLPDHSLAFSKIDAGVSGEGVPTREVRKTSSSKSSRREPKHRETQNEHSMLAKAANIARWERDTAASRVDAGLNPISAG